MGLTQHRHAVPMISEITNLLLMRGMIGKPGAGLCPVRGHSNVQGDRTMGIWKMPEMFLAALDARFGIVSPREHGLDTVDAIRAMRDGRAKVFMGMGGNFASATGYRRHGGRAAQLRADRAGLDQAEPQPRGARIHSVDPAVTGPHRSRRPGRRPTSGVGGGFDVDGASVPRQPAAAVQWCAARSRSSVNWPERCSARPSGVVGRFNGDYDTIQEAIAAVVPGCADYNAKVRQADGFQLPNGPRDSREFPPAQAKPTSR